MPGCGTSTGQPGGMGCSATRFSRRPGKGDEAGAGGAAGNAGGSPLRDAGQHECLDEVHHASDHYPVSIEVSLG